MGKGEQVRARAGWLRSVIRIKLAISWELRAVSSILSKSQSSPVIKMKSIISLKFSWEIFSKLSVKENEKTIVIFMPSFTHNRWLGDAGCLSLAGRLWGDDDKTSPVIKRKSIEKYLGKLSLKANDTAPAIFISSFYIYQFSVQYLHLQPVWAVWTVVSTLPVLINDLGQGLTVRSSPFSHLVIINRSQCCPILEIFQSVINETLEYWWWYKLRSTPNTARWSRNAVRELNDVLCFRRRQGGRQVGPEKLMETVETVI